MGNCFSHEATFPSYAFNQVIKRLEIWLCWKEYWLYLHKPPSSSLRDLFPRQTIPAVCTDRRARREDLPFARGTDHGAESYVPTFLGFWRGAGAGATSGSPSAGQTSPGKAAQSLWDNRELAPHRASRRQRPKLARAQRWWAAWLGASRTPTAGEQQRVLWVCVVFLLIAARQWIG